MNPAEVASFEKWDMQWTMSLMAERMTAELAWFNLGATLSAMVSASFESLGMYIIRASMM
jgi:hypothetical protein